MISLGWFLKFAVLRLMAQWRALLMVIIGVLLAAVIGANGTLYTAAVSQVGMIERLERQPPETNQIYTRISFKGKEQSDLSTFWADLDAQLKAQVQTTLVPDLPGWLHSTVTALEAPAVDTFKDGQPLEAVRIRPVYYENWQEAVEIVEGALPSETPADVDFEAVMSVPAASLLGLNVGDIISLEEQGWDTSVPARVRISGLVSERDPQNLYWTPPAPLRIDTNATGQSDIEILLNRDAAVKFATVHVPDSTVRLIWRVYFDYTNLAFNDVALALDRLETFQSELRPILEPPDLPRRSFVFELGVEDVLKSYQEEVQRINAPFNLLLLQIGALVLLFLSVIIALARRGERREIALLQSRGAAGYQIILVRGLEALMICVAAGLIAPFIARWLLVTLAPVILNINRLSLEITSDAFSYSLAAALAAFVVMVVTLYPVLRQPLITAGGSAARAGTQAWWQRYYLDLVVMVVGFIGLWRLLNSSSALIEGRNTADPLLILAPALLFVALGSILLRIFPGMVGLFAHFVSTQRGLGRVLAGWQVSREPAHYARITLLLALAVGIGWFASSFLATFERSQSDRARFEIGADVRISEGDTPLALDEYRAMPEVESVTQLIRFDEVPVAVNTLSFDTGDFLAVDFETFRETAYWRDDLGALKAPGDSYEIPTLGEPVPFVPAKIGMWVYPGYVNNFNGETITSVAPLPFLTTMTTFVNLRSEDGIQDAVWMEFNEAEGIDLAAAQEQLPLFDNFNPQFLPDDVENPYEGMTGWFYLEGEVNPELLNAEGEVRLESIMFSSFTNGFGPPSTWSVFITDFTFFDADGNAVSVDLMQHESLGTLQDGLPDSVAALEYTELEQAQNSEHPAKEGLRATWQETGQNTRMMVTFNFPNQTALPVLVTPSFLELNNLDVGLNFQLYLGQNVVNLNILDIVDYYPTLYGSARPFLIMDVNRLITVARSGMGTFDFNWETWIKLKPGTDETAFLQSLAEKGILPASIQTASQQLEAYEADSLSVGLIGLLFLSFLIVLVLSIISLLTYSILTAQARRIEFGVLQALGVAPGRLVASVAIEQGLILGIAVMLGALLGTVLSSQVIPTLSNSSSAENSLPFVVQFEAAALAQYGMLMAVVLGVVLVVSLLLVRRLSLAQALRLGEE